MVTFGPLSTKIYSSQGKTMFDITEQAKMEAEVYKAAYAAAITANKGVPERDAEQAVFAFRNFFIRLGYFPNPDEPALPPSINGPYR